MDKEFHYWVTGLVAEYAGFPLAECRTVAYTSQYTDDNNNTVEVFDGEFDVSPSYISHVSQTADVSMPKDDIMKIFPLFHFLPGDITSQRKDGINHPLITTPDSSFANKIMTYTLQNAVSRYTAKDKSCLYRIGIAAHCYVDTWAHQNFMGWFSKMNQLEGPVFLKIGHGDAGHDPDPVGNRWHDPRLIDEEIDNNKRFIVAAEKLYLHLSAFCRQASLSPRGTWSELENLLTLVWQVDDVSERTRRYRKASKALKDYDNRRWEADAFIVKNVLDPSTEGGMGEKRVWRSDVKKPNTDWYKFQEAVKGHIVDASNILRPAFVAAGIHI